MLRALSVIPDAALEQELAEHMKSMPGARLARAASSYASIEALLTAIRVERPDFLLVYVGDLGQMESLIEALESLSPGTPVIGMGKEMKPEQTLNLTRGLMHLGVREYVEFPLDRAKLAEAIGAVERYLAKHPKPARVSTLYSFLPAKAGIGCSTIAVAIASTLAQDARTRLLLIDGDLYAGPVRFLLKMGASASFLDALAHGDMLDEDMWRQMVANNGSLDVLHAGEHLPPPVLPTEQLGQVLALARKLYDVICVDLPGTFDPLSLGLLQESQRIFLITTAELTPLHFAKARLKQLGELGLQDRVSLVVNRHQARDQDHLTDEQVAQSVGIPVSFTFPNIYHSVQHAILEGNAVPQAGGMPEAVQALVHFMAPSHDQQSPQGGRKFLEFFRIPSGTAGSSPHP